MPRDAAPHLLRLLEEGGHDRPALRTAVREAFDRAPDAMSPWTREPTSPEAAAAVALALAASDAGRDTAGALVAWAKERATDFATRYRLVDAARLIGAQDADTDAWLAQLAAEAEDWALRALALEALAARGAPRAAGLSAAALADPSPRVRTTALALLTGRAPPLREVAALARRDRWPMVRAAAVRALAGHADGLPMLRRAVGDPGKGVRAAAIEGLAAAGDGASLPLIEERLRDEREWPEVIRAALGFVRTECALGAVDALGAVVARALRPNPWEPDLDVAGEAVLVLGHLGGEEAEALLARAARSRIPVLEASARLATERGPGCSASGD
jgi:HEAT repeat protein